MSVILPVKHQDEIAIVGCCMAGGLETAIEAVECLNSEALTHPEVQGVFRIIEQLATTGTEVNSYTVAKAWTESSEQPLPMTVIGADGIPANLTYHVESVTQAWRKRKIILACSSVVERSQIDTVTADDLIGDVEKSLGGEEIVTVPTLNGKECASKLIDDLERRFNLGGKLSGISTGFRDLDRLTCGLQYGEQTLIGARPSMGKTALGVCILANACLKNRVPTQFVSLEMSVPALMRRLCSIWTGITMTELRRGSYTEEQFRRFTTFRDTASKAPLWITDAVSGIGINQLCASIRRRIRKDGVKLVIIDYLQKIKASTRQEKRTYEVGEVSGMLRSLAVSTGAAFLTLAQLNRESEKDKQRVPRLSDLGDSGQIERDADTVILIHRKRDESTGDANLIVAKQRDGEVGIVDVKFDGPHAQFEDAPIGE